ncbi:MAG: hypothetical protein ACT4TC_13380 [Myxococcaceae bacterium]
MSFTGDESPLSIILYRLEDHEFVSGDTLGALECWKCGQRSSIPAVKAAINSGTRLYESCPNERAIVNPEDRCNLCAREMSRSYLDFYTGHDPIERDLCRDCRPHHARLAAEWSQSTF